MMDLNESLRGLYYAPMPLVVLSSVRTIKMLNKPAEKILGIGNMGCSGQKLDRYITASSKAPFTSALNQATEGNTSSDKAIPVSTRLQLYNPDSTTSSTLWADLTISTWYRSDPLSKDLSEAINEQYGIGSSTHPQYAARVAHETLYTISIMPSSTLDFPDSRSSENREDTANMLKETFFQCSDIGILAMSRDGKTEIRNQAFDKILSVFSPYQSRAEEIGDNTKEVDGGIMAVIKDTITVYDEDFHAPLEVGEWPIIKCATLGWSVPSVILGVEAKLTGERVTVEVVSKAVRDRGGYGEHVGGVCTVQDITTERRKIKLAAEQQGDAYFRNTIDQIPQLIWVASGSGGALEWFSKSYLEYVGCTLQDIQGASWQGLVPEDQLPELGKQWSRSIRTGEKLEIAIQLKRHDGEFRWFLSRAMPMVDQETGSIIKWFGTCTDIHDQVEALSASRRTQIQLQSVVNHAAVTLWAVDLNGIITVAEGPGVRELHLMTPAEEIDAMQVDGQLDEFGASGKSSKDSVIGNSIYKYWRASDVRGSIDRALQGDTVISEMEVKSRWFRNSYTPLRAQPKDLHFMYGLSQQHLTGERHVDTCEGDIVGVVIASMDITDRKETQKQMEESLIEKTRALTAEGAAREASRLKSEFLANMSHEIRTPIAGIIGLTELLLEEEGLAAMHIDYAETIHRAAEGLLTVINDVLDFSKVEIGKLEVESVPFNLVVLLRDLKRMLTFTTQRKGLEFKEVLEIKYRGQLLGDLGRLRQVVTNLLTNAIKFTAHGHISLEVTELSADANKVLIRFDIRDTGCGIDSETLSKLFQPFSQADASTARRFGGTGLGLSISKNLVELMNGKIGLDSVQGKGSHAWFVIPFRKANVLSLPIDKKKRRVDSPEEAMNGFAAADSEEEPYCHASTGGIAIVVPTRLSRPRKDIWILIAEDNAVNARIASKNVEKLGFNCKVADNGNKALEELKQQEYDLVLMDCQMPDCDGYEATRLIRKDANEDIRSIPVIALTASAIKGDRERALEAGMVDYLAKPVKRNALEGTLCKWLFDHNARQELSKFLTAPVGVNVH